MTIENARRTYKVMDKRCRAHKEWHVGQGSQKWNPLLLLLGMPTLTCHPIARYTDIITKLYIHLCCASILNVCILCFDSVLWRHHTYLPLTRRQSLRQASRRRCCPMMHAMGPLGMKTLQQSNPSKPQSIWYTSSVQLSLAFRSAS